METGAAYQDTLNYLYSFVDYSLTRGFRNLPGQFDLERMAEFMRYLGNPHHQYPIIHVAGTKGKGSVCALCAAALRAGGYRVGLYTSPHLEDYTERIQVDGRPISPAALTGLVEEIRPYLDGGTKLTTFEITTALAFLHFARSDATAVVAEVGLGGRLDATNVVSPLVTVITTISYDHMQVLGNTLGEIAGEKAGIIKSGVPVVVSNQPAEARASIERIAQERGAPLIWANERYLPVPLSHSLESQSFLAQPVHASEADALRLTIPLLGAHQTENAITALVALQAANKRGLAIERQAIQDGFAMVYWPGRFEIIRRDPPIVVDSAHNPASAGKLRQAIEDYFPDREVILIFGASEDKDIDGMLAELAPVVRQWIITRSFHPRAVDPEIPAKAAAAYGKPVRIVPEVGDALNVALQDVDHQSLIVAAGSLFVAAAVRQTWTERYPHP